MPFQYSFHNGRQPTNIAIDRFPDFCPICHSAVEPIQTGASFASSRWAELVLRCPRSTCEHLFLARYTLSSSAAGHFGSAVPVTPIATTHSTIVNLLSPAFVKIHGQAEAAENMQLDEIAGVGYRRSLEFLLKDYLLSVHPQVMIQEDIRKQFLGQCVEKYVKNENIKLVAKRAVWLGNDETHYVRKWEDRDIRDLKNVIAMTVNWIELERRTLELQQEMPQGK